MIVTSEDSIRDHIDFLVMQPSEEHNVVRDLMFAVLAFNLHGQDEALQISFPLFTDAKMQKGKLVGPCVRVSGPSERLYVLTLRHEISGHSRAGRAMTLVRDRVVIDADRHERFNLVAPNARTGRPIIIAGQSRLLETAGRLGVPIENEVVFVARGESNRSIDGTVDLLGFSERKTVPVLR